MAQQTGFLRPNATQIPDLILDNLEAFTDTELRIVLCIARATLGWHKDRDWLTRSELVTRTGRTSRAVSSAVKHLVDRNILIVQGSDGELLDSPEARRRVGESHQRLWFSLNVDELISICSVVEESKETPPIPDQGNEDTLWPDTEVGRKEDVYQGKIFPGPQDEPSMSRARVVTSKTLSIRERSLKELAVPDTDTEHQEQLQEQLPPIKLDGSNKNTDSPIDLWKFIENHEFLRNSPDLRSALLGLRDTTHQPSPQERVSLLSAFLFNELENHDEAWNLRRQVFCQVGQFTTRYPIPFLVWAFLTMRRIPIDKGQKVALFGPIVLRYQTWCAMVNDARAELEADQPAGITEEDLREVGADV
jgi:phage replication O-like protein O